MYKGVSAREGLLEPTEVEGTDSKVCARGRRRGREGKVVRRKKGGNEGKKEVEEGFSSSSFIVRFFIHS